MKRLATLGISVLVLSGCPTWAAAQESTTCSGENIQVSSGGGCTVLSADICCTYSLGDFSNSWCAYCHYGVCKEPAEIELSCTDTE